MFSNVSVDVSYMLEVLLIIMTLHMLQSYESVMGAAIWTPRVTLCGLRAFLPLEKDYILIMIRMLFITSKKYSS